MAGAAATVCALVGCGKDGSPTQTAGTGAAAHASTRTTSAAPRAATRIGHWRFVRRPIVVAVPDQDGSPNIAVYFKLDHNLTTGHHVVVTVNGVWNLDVSGTGYDDAAAEACYFKLLDNTDSFPRSLRRIKAGQHVLVRVRVTHAVPSTLSARVPVAIALPSEDDVVPSEVWLKRLGCAN
jgi:hypothetical protein